MAAKTNYEDQDLNKDLENLSLSEKRNNRQHVEIPVKKLLHYVSYDRCNEKPNGIFFPYPDTAANLGEPLKQRPLKLYSVATADPPELIIKFLNIKDKVKISLKGSVIFHGEISVTLNDFNPHDVFEIDFELNDDTMDMGLNRIENIRIGTFNIRKHDDIVALSKAIQYFDLIVLLEVSQSNINIKGLERHLWKLENNSQHCLYYKLESSYDGEKEKCVYFYNTRYFIAMKPNYDEGKIENLQGHFKFTPFIVLFQTKFCLLEEFIFIPLHITTESGKTFSELNKLNDVVSILENETQKNFIIGGDLNLGTAFMKKEKIHYFLGKIKEWRWEPCVMSSDMLYTKPNSRTYYDRFERTFLV
ncbi:DgyrCDS3177 [Dimorphilus gyrociliatus]|uniref:DgyrCDS3177 n=1 Tax=Dimorphilus gyrociliatus TaxID=2664684 RepID=A0A7I8VEA6_9ANNE|nr:DgyrCDS3177 [Dimorphilus gyrociliatus]